MSCGSCGAANPEGAKFCNQCGTRLPTGDDAPAPSGPTPSAPAISLGAGEAERRQLTVMFCDLVGSTELSGRLDPEDMRGLLRTYHDVSATAIRAADGYVAQYLGDGLLVYFGYPVAREDSAARAVHAALGIVEAIQHVNVRLRQTKDLSLQVRIGIHTGPVVVSDVGGELRQERLAVGETPNLAARLQGLAAPNTIVISEATHRLARGLFRVREMGPQSLKGVAHPVAAFEVLERSGARSDLDAGARGDLTPLTGRGEVVEGLLASWKAAQRGEGPMVLLSGEPGIGKSRHVQTLIERIAGDAPTVLRGACVEGAEGTPLTPIVELVRKQLDAVEGATAEERYAGVVRAFAECAECAPGSAALVASLLGIPAGALYELPAMPPQRLRLATFEAILGWLAHRAAHGPVLLVIEDLHWADPSTTEVLSLFAQRPATPRLLAVMTARPGFVAPWPASERFTCVTLEHLRREDAARIVDRVAGGRAMPEDLLETILQRADGVPLYLEEITKNVLESDRVHVGIDRIEVRGGLARDLIPPAVQDSLTARLDRLGPGRALAQLAAAVGREFSFEVLRDLGLLDEDGLRRELDRMMEAGLVLSKDGAGSRFEFKHALIRDAAYQSLARSTRQRYHSQILRVLVDRSPEIEQRQPELLAQHYAGAGLAGEAIERWQRAGQGATAAAAFREAASHFTKALEAEAALPPSRERDRREITLRSGLGLALISTQGFASAQVEATYARAAELCAQADEIPFPIFYGIWAVVLVRGDREGVDRLVHHMERLAETSPDTAVRIVAWSSLASSDFYAGRFRAAEQRARRAIDLVSACDPQELLQSLLGYSSEAMLYGHLYGALAGSALGHLEAAATITREALAIAEKVDNVYMVTMALASGGSTLIRAGEVDEGLAMCRRALTMSVENGLPFWTAVAKTGIGTAKVCLGEPAEALRELTEGFALMKMLGCTVLVPMWSAWLAEAHAANGTLDEGVTVAEEGLAFSRTSLPGERPVVDLLRALGMVQIRRGAPAEAEHLLRAALAGATEEEAHLQALQVATELASVLDATGRRAEARELLTAAIERAPEARGRHDGLQAQKVLTSLA